MDQDDLNFVQMIIPLMGITKTIVMEWDNSNDKYPDIWIQKGFFSDTITVTREWQRQNFHERRKRLVHELLHSLGENHWDEPKIVNVNGVDISVLYSTYPDQDTYSALVYSHLLNKTNEFL